MWLCVKVLIAYFGKFKKFKIKILELPFFQILFCLNLNLKCIALIKNLFQLKYLSFCFSFIYSFNFCVSICRSSLDWEVPASAYRKHCFPFHSPQTRHNIFLSVFLQASLFQSFSAREVKATKGAFKTEGQTKLFCSVTAIRLRHTFICLFVYSSIYLFIIFFLCGKNGYLLSGFLGCPVCKVQLSLKA